MTLIAKPATPGLWCDLSAPLTEGAAKAIAERGYVGVFLYLPLPRNSSANDASAERIGWCVSAGLEVGCVQHVRGFPPHDPLWTPAEHDGAEDAMMAVSHARLCGIPERVHLFQDLEAVDGTSSATIQYTVQWGATVRVAGYRAGLYVGYSVPMTSTQLYELPDHDCYWSDAGHRTVAIRGCAIKQGCSLPASGAIPPIDEDTVEPDALKGLPWVCAAASEATAQ